MYRCAYLLRSKLPSDDFDTFQTRGKKTHIQPSFLLANMAMTRNGVHLIFTPPAQASKIRIKLARDVYLLSVQRI
jgi:hypothetical protein